MLKRLGLCLVVVLGCGESERVSPVETGDVEREAAPVQGEAPKPSAPAKPAGQPLAPVAQNPAPAPVEPPAPPDAGEPAPVEPPPIPEVEVIDASPGTPYQCGDLDRAWGVAMDVIDTYRHDPSGEPVGWIHCLSLVRSCQALRVAESDDWLWGNATAEEQTTCAGPVEWMSDLQIAFYEAEGERGRCYTGPWAGAACNETDPEIEGRSRGEGLPPGVRLEGQAPVSPWKAAE